MFDVSRDQARSFFFEVRQKHTQGLPLTPLENIALTIIEHHPEYHSILDQPERYKDKSWHAQEAEMNPFLHLSLHLAIEEQLSIDQPPGIRAAYDKLALNLKDEHAARHVLLESLMEMIWQAQTNGKSLDNMSYLTLVQQHKANG